MDVSRLNVLQDISKSPTLPGEFYRGQDWFDLTRDKVFPNAWHCIGLSDELPEAETAQPFELLPGYLSEPLLLTRDQDGTRYCLSNVCTHRANLLVSDSGPCREIKCRYHGRRFSLDGKMRNMPEFKAVKNFPSEADNLPHLPLGEYGPLLFANLGQGASFEEWIAPVRRRIDWMKPEEFVHAPQYSALYEIDAHWALYVDNYLEGFHIPFVHPGLNQILNYADYRYETFPQGLLQIGMAKDGEDHFEIPAGQPETDQKVAAYYFWMFPNLMFNFYPWGLSLNMVEPVSPSLTRVRYETFLWAGKGFDEQNWAFTSTTEFEDQAIVESVQKGINSRLYQSGRFSVNMEPGVHHFHLLLQNALSS